MYVTRCAFGYSSHFGMSACAPIDLMRFLQSVIVLSLKYVLNCKFAMV